MRLGAIALFGGSHVRLWIAAVVLVVAIGSVGYVVLGWPLGDAVYMTGITLTTVGYREVRELDEVGRAWTILVAIAGVGIIFGSVGIVAEAVLSDAASGRREAKRMTQSVAALRRHLILCGYGRVGSTVARELAHAGERFVVVDINPASLVTAEHDGHLVVVGDATSDAVLAEAGIERARVRSTRRCSSWRGRTRPGPRRS
jgi:voltage-gated potassium channel